MSSLPGRTIKAVMILTSVFVILGCNFSPLSVNVVASEPARLSTWLAYWDLDAGHKDLTKLGDGLDKLFFFGAYFDRNDRVIIPPELSGRYGELRKSKGKYVSYLTFINDRQSPDGQIIMKDTEVLRRLFADEAALEKHIDEIVALTLKGGYDGLEIDYEKIWSDEYLGQTFVHFVNRLYIKTLKTNLKMRVVLEPGTPFATAGFINGPEYVVMLYNLYGLHSKPGPKANKDFIQKTIARMAPLPGEKAVALATGGCFWGSNGKKGLLTEVEAKTIAKINDAVERRDEDSQCVVFDYQDKHGVTYEVWYADAKTLKFWISVAQAKGVNNISLWRLGGNVDINKVK